VATLFLGLWPNVMPSSTSPAFNLTVHNASSTPYTLGVMTWVAAIFTPLVLCYQSWTYWVFRRRLRRDDYQATTGVSSQHPVLDQAAVGP
jgi:cytochrome bd ubiquinol oxidase subunit II